VSYPTRVLPLGAGATLGVLLAGGASAKFIVSWHAKKRASGYPHPPPIRVPVLDLNSGREAFAVCQPIASLMRPKPNRTTMDNGEGGKPEALDRGPGRI